MIALALAARGRFSTACREVDVEPRSKAECRPLQTAANALGRSSVDETQPSHACRLWRLWAALLVSGDACRLANIQLRIPPHMQIICDGCRRNGDGLHGQP